MNNTTRMYSRNSALAFRDAEYANAIEQPPMNTQDRVFLWACAACFVAFLLVVFLVPEAK